jgi:hypothetical protein
MECLADSALPSDLRALGYGVREIGYGERILPHQIVQRFFSCGELEPLSAASTKPIAETRKHPALSR